MELSVVALGLLLGGVAGLGTIVYALGIGPLSQALLPPFLVGPPTRVDVSDCPTSSGTVAHSGLLGIGPDPGGPGQGRYHMSVRHQLRVTGRTARPTSSSPARSG